MHKNQIYLHFRSQVGYYYIGYFDDLNTLRWFSTRCKRKSEALKVLSDFKNEIKLRPNSPRLTDFIADFLNYAESVYALQTIEKYRFGLNSLQQIVGNPPIASITTRHCDQFKAEKLKTIAPVTVNIYLNTLRAAFNTAIRWDLITVNPFSRIKNCREEDVKPKFMTKEEFHKLIAGIEEEWMKDIVLFGVMTGMRRAEITNLTWDKVDMERRVISVESSGTFKVKTGKQRNVPMNVAVQNLMLKRKNMYNTNYVFSIEGRRVFDDWCTALFKWYVRKLELNPKLNFKCLRSTFASWLSQSGESIYSISRLLGHCRVDVTAKHYAYLQPEQLHGTVEKLDALAAPPEPENILKFVPANSA